MLLETNGCYIATVKLGFFEAKLAGNETIAEKLAAAGFRNVQVQGSGRSREVSGIWAGQTMDVDPASLDDHLTNVKRIL